MRVLQVGSGMARWGGSERYLMDATIGLRKRGHDMTVACAPTSMLNKWCEETDQKKIPLEMRHFSDWSQTPSFLKAYRAGQYDVVHIHGAFDYLVPAVCARLAGVPAVVMTRHLPHPFSSKLRAYLCSPVLYDKIIVVADFGRVTLLESGIPRERIAVVHNGIAAPEPLADGGTLREELGIPADALMVASAGRLTTGKGFPVIVKAISLLKTQGCEVYAVIFGHGELKEELLAQAEELGVSHLIRLPGFRTDVARLWAAADVAVIASDGPESFPYTALEALAAGKPVVGSRMGGIPEIVIAECGVIVSPGNAEELVAGIHEVLYSRDRQAMGRAALDTYRQKFTLDRAIDGLEQVYREVVGPR